MILVLGNLNKLFKKLSNIPLSNNKFLTFERHRVYSNITNLSKCYRKFFSLYGFWCGKLDACTSVDILYVYK